MENKISEVKEKQDSIKVTQGATGKMSYEIKRYYDFTEETPELVIDSMKKIYDKLKKEFEVE